MSAPTLHLKGFDPDQSWSLSRQVRSLAAELEAAVVFQTAARRDLDAGDLRALGRIYALGVHERQLREQLAQLTQPDHEPHPH